MKYLKYALPGTLLLLITSCWSLPSDPTKTYRTTASRDFFQPGSLPVFQTGIPEAGPLSEYWKRFGDELGDRPWALGRLPFLDHDLAVGLRRPSIDPKGVVLYIHGYLSHSGNFQPLYNRLLDQGYWVVTVDLPGHGLSGPDSRGDIREFSDYGKMVEVLQAWIDSLPGLNELPRYGIGHSTGALSLFEYSAHHPLRFKKLIFGAPLTKSFMFGPSIFAAAVSWPFTTWYPLGKSSDPLGVPYLPLHWFWAMNTWNGPAAGYPENKIPLLQITGDKDMVVDTQYGLELMGKKFPDRKVVIIPGLKHEVFMVRAYRDQVFEKVLEFLAQP